MTKFQMDFDELKKSMGLDNKIPVKGNEEKIIRVAFDLFRFKDGDPEELWQVQSSDDGEFLVRTYLLPEEQNISEGWSINTDKKEENLTVAYKEVPIFRISAKNFGSKTPEDTLILKRALYKKISNDEKFLTNLVNALPAEKKELLKEAGFSFKINERLLALELYLQKKARATLFPDEPISPFDEEEDIISKKTPEEIKKELSPEELKELKEILDKI